VADQLIETGAIEAVVTGGEPLLRKDLTIEICRRLASAGLGVTLNSNGWFIDDEVATRLAEAPGLHVHVSVDGPAPEIHDASRGVPGSWRRAIGGLDALIRHGVAVHAVHVVTDQNIGLIGETLDQLHALGIPAVRITPVVEVGAAARQGGWRVKLDPLVAAVEAARERIGDSMSIGLQSGEGTAELIKTANPPGALLVRPNGSVRTDSLIPFEFGHAIEDGLGTCWERIREHWRDPTIDGWRASITKPRDHAVSPIVPYLDDEVPIGPAANRPKSDEGDPRTAPVPRPTPPTAISGRAIGDPKAHVDALALGRLYRHGEVRAARYEGRAMVRRRSDGRVWRLNRSASIVFGCLNGGTPADAIAELEREFPDAPAERLRRDALAATGSLMRREIVLPGEAATVTRVDVTSPSDLPQVSPG
jgi:hypothetical protein